MEIAPKKNNSVAESATEIGLDTYIGDVNVIILEGDRANFDVSLCDAVHYQTKTSSLVSKDNDKIRDTKVADSETDALENKEIGGNITLNIKHETSRKTKHACNDDITAKYTGTSNYPEFRYVYYDGNGRDKGRHGTIYGPEVCWYTCFDT